jgi:hypothetical protein
MGCVAASFPMAQQIPLALSVIFDAAGVDFTLLALKSGKIVRTAVPLTESIVEAVCGNQALQIPWNLFY